MIETKDTAFIDALGHIDSCVKVLWAHEREHDAATLRLYRWHHASGPGRGWGWYCDAWIAVCSVRHTSFAFVPVADITDGSEIASILVAEALLAP